MRRRWRRSAAQLPRRHRVAVPRRHPCLGQGEGGLKMAPSCADCHGTHEITPKTSATSRTHKNNVPATCGSCHEGVAEHYNQSIHAAALKTGNAAAPTCADCHAAHATQRADGRQLASRRGGRMRQLPRGSRRFVPPDVPRQGHRAGLHTRRGVRRLPRRARDPAGLEPGIDDRQGQLVETCGSCHKGRTRGSSSTIRTRIRADYARSPLLWWINRFYTVLITGCFAAVRPAQPAVVPPRERQEKRRS